MGTMQFFVNNGGELHVTQEKPDDDVILSRYDGGEKTYGLGISAGDMVMLMNLYRYVKENDIQNGFINPNGKTKEAISDDDSLLWDLLKSHWEHKVEIGIYGDPDEPMSVTLEDMDTNEIILDAELYTLVSRN